MPTSPWRIEVKDGQENEDSTVITVNIAMKEKPKQLIVKELIEKRSEERRVGKECRL